jgi:hypothetical protein
VSFIKLRALIAFFLKKKKSETVHGQIFRELKKVYIENQVAANTDIMLV